MAMLYIHIPLCSVRCAYCDFYSTTMRGREDELCNALIGEMEQRAEMLSGEVIETIYIGGGTPSQLSSRHIAQLIERAHQLFECRTSEITLEANPDDLTAEYLRQLSQTPINRLSIGIQSFDDDVLRFLRRRHTASQAIEAIADARKVGFDNITIDLMYGIAPMGPGVWQRTLDTAIDIGAEHISAYHLTIEQGTALHKMGIEPVDELRSESEFLQLHHSLSSAGYEHYEISNFARAGRRAKHNSGYWNGTHYLGIGPSAHSYDGQRRLWADADLQSYLTGGVTITEEVLTPNDRYNEYVMTRLRTTDGMNIEELEQLFGHKLCQHFERQAQISLKCGNMELLGAIYRLPSVKLLISDTVIGSLLI